MSDEKTAYLPRKLDTVQSHGNINRVFAQGNIDSENARDQYAVIRPDQTDDTGEMIAIIDFESDFSKGVVDQDLLEMIRDRIRARIEGSKPTAALEHALQHVEEALLWLGKHCADKKV